MCSKRTKKLNSNSRKRPPKQSYEHLEANTNNLLKQKLDDYDLANKRFQETLTKTTNQITDQAAIEKFVTQLQVMKVEIDIQRAEAIQLVQAVDGKLYKKVKEVLHAC